MSTTVTSRYGDLQAARNAREELIDKGFPSEKVFLDKDKAEVKVIASQSNEREVREILDSHQPAEVTATPT